VTRPLDEAKVLVYTVTRADTPARVKAAAASLLLGQKTAGLSCDWIIYCNSPQMHEWAQWAWRNGQTWGTGENVGQHVALRDVLAYARAEGYDFIVKVDDDVEWMTRRWLRRLVVAAYSIHAASSKWCLVGPRVFSLSNPIPHALDTEVPSVESGRTLPIRVMPIIGGLVRLHHISFFKDYFLDVRRAMGSGGDASIRDHSVGDDGPKVASIVCRHVRVRHNTKKQQADDPVYHRMHRVMQLVPFIPNRTGGTGFDDRAPDATGEWPTQDGK
jgi:hypothetical protein